MRPVNITNTFIVIVFIIMVGAAVISPEVKAKVIDYGKLLNSEWLDSKKIGILDEVKKHDATIIQFWASWCAGCGENMVGLAKIKAHFDSLGIKIGFFPVTIDDKKEDAINYFKLRSDAEFLAAFPFAVWDKDMELASSVEIPSVPYFLVVDSLGNIKKSFAGHLSDSARIETIKVISECFQSGSALKIIKEDK